MAQNTDDIFASLGGSLMKDLWDDLQVGEDDLKADGWSLEQLERELAHLEEPPPPPPPGLSAASMVVSHAQGKQQQQQLPPQTAALPTTTSAADAWSEALQNFTALSLEKDFLAADTARKQQTAPPGLENLKLFEGATDYDVSEQVQLGVPPPGMGAPPGLAAAEEPKQPQERQAPAVVEQHKPPGLPQQQAPPPKQPPQQQQQPTAVLRRPQPQQPMVMQQQQQPPPHMQQQPAMPPMQQQPPPMRQSGGMAWQSPPPQQMRVAPTPARVYCQPHPSAPPIPATVLESTYMKARDITYVLHSMLKPVLLMPASSDYHLELLSRHYVQQQNVRQPTGAISGLRSDTAVSIKSKEWMEKHSTLGHVSKSDVTRPRALIATTTLSKEQVEQDDGTKKQRATLWKSRLYIDQAYQAYNNLVRTWKASAAGRVSPQEIQPHLLRLYKFLGISVSTSQDGTTTVDSAALGIILKLSKGKVLVARVVEQALLPPHVVQALMPAIFEILLPAASNKDDPAAENRLFGACARVLTTLPSLTSANVASCLQQFLTHSKHALDTTFRMECIHALLKRGGDMAAADPEFASQTWNAMEEQFLKIIS